MSAADLDANDRRRATWTSVLVPSAGAFQWWDTALDVANRRAFVSGRRHIVKATKAGTWSVQEAGA